MAADSTTPGKAAGFVVNENTRAVGELTVGAPSGGVVDRARDRHVRARCKGAPIEEALAAAGEFLASVKQGDQVAIVGFGHTASWRSR